MMIGVRDLKPIERPTYTGSAEEEGPAVPVIPQTRIPAGPANGSAWLPERPGQSRPMNAGMLALGALPSSPFWARRYTRRFLASCLGLTESTADTAELIVSELVTNAVRFSGDPARPLRYSERASAGLISLSLRHFLEGLLIEVFDTDANPPVLSDPDMYAEGGRGLMLVDALAKQWSYFFPPGGGKVVYCILDIARD
jgi:anti-sigma regulatory factor (Ser/Thr protein kinase)